MVRCVRSGVGPRPPQWGGTLCYCAAGQFSDVLYEQIVDVCTINALKYNASITDARLVMRDA